MKCSTQAAGRVAGIALAGGDRSTRPNARRRDTPPCTTDASDAFIAEDDSQNVAAGKNSAAVAGNNNFACGEFSAVLGSQINEAFPAATNAGIVAGEYDVVKAVAAFIGSGNSNDVTTAATYATIVGGARNTVSAAYAAVEGGYGNTASGAYAIVTGGNGDTAAGTLSLAAGYHADAAHKGSFVWSDYVSGSSAVKDTAANQFIVRSSGGGAFSSNEAMTSGVRLASGSGTWSSLSDRNAKTDIVPLDDVSILAKVSTLPIGTWRCKLIEAQRAQLLSLAARVRRLEAR